MNKIIIRIDDFISGIRPIQPDFIPIYKKIFDCFQKENIEIHLAVVPALLSKEHEFIKKYDNIVFCQHGFDHCYDYYSKILTKLNDLENEKTIGVFDEFQGLSEDYIYNKLIEGKRILENFTGQFINTYIPVCNIANENTVNAINKIYKKVLGQNIREIPYSVENPLFQFYGRLSGINYTKNQKSFAFHCTWEYSEIKKLGFDKWLENFNKFAEYYHSFDEKKVIIPQTEEMIFYTSINPNPEHYERQKTAIQTWQKLGIKFYSINNIAEISNIKKLFLDVDFIEVTETAEKTHGKKYIYINTILEIAKQNNSKTLCLINSDIEIKPQDNLLEQLQKNAENGLVIASRFNYDIDYSDAKMEAGGIDIFAFNSKYIDIIPKDDTFAMGSPVWDYWLPFQFGKNNIPVYHIRKPLFFHKLHDRLWKRDTWEKALHKIGKEHKYKEKDAGKLSRIMYDIFMKNVKVLEPHFDSLQVPLFLKGIKNPVIFECGANRGMDTEKFAQIPNATIHAFEPDPRNNLERLPDNVIKNYKAVAEKDGIIDFYMSDKYKGAEGWTESSSIREPKNHLNEYPYVTFGNKTQVQCVSLDSYCKDNKIDYIDFLWADIQGAEENMILGAKNIFKKTKYIFTEYSDNELYKGQINSKKILELLPDFYVMGYYNNNILLGNKNYLDKKQKIAKKAFFIWGKGTPLSYLRYLTLESFRRFHPDYKMTLYLSKGIEKKNWNSDAIENKGLNQEYYAKDKDTIEDWLEKTAELAVEVKEYNDFPQLNPAHQSDLFRWDIIYKEGGWYFDLDQLFLKRIDEKLLSYDFVFGGKQQPFVGAIGGSKGFGFFKYIYDKQVEIINTKPIQNYLEFSVPLFESCLDSNYYKAIDKNTILHTEQVVFYPVHWGNLKSIYSGEVDLLKFKDTIALHWHGGADVSQEFNKKFNPELKQASNDSISKYLRFIEAKEEKQEAKINLFVQYYIDSLPERQKEYEHCITKNIKSGLFDRIFIYTDDNTDLSFFKQFEETIYNLNIADNKKLTHNEFFEATRNLGKNDINVLANTDIYFNETILLTHTYLHFDSCMCLTRYNIQADRRIVFYNKDSSQDVWIIRGHAKNVNGNFPLAFAGTDNRIAYEFRESGYNVSNPSSTIKTFHYHITEKRNYIRRTINNEFEDDRVPEPYLFIEPSSL